MGSEKLVHTPRLGRPGRQVGDRGRSLGQVRDSELFFPEIVADNASLGIDPGGGGIETLAKVEPQPERYRGSVEKVFERRLDEEAERGRGHLQAITIETGLERFGRQHRADHDQNTNPHRCRPPHQCHGAPQNPDLIRTPTVKTGLNPDDWSGTANVRNQSSSGSLPCSPNPTECLGRTSSPEFQTAPVS